MFTTGEKVEFNGHFAIILTEFNDEVLIYLDRNHIRWVQKSQLVQAAIA